MDRMGVPGIPDEEFKIVKVNKDENEVEKSLDLLSARPGTFFLNWPRSRTQVFK